MDEDKVVGDLWRGLSNENLIPHDASVLYKGIEQLFWKDVVAAIIEVIEGRRGQSEWLPRRVCVHQQVLLVSI